MMHQYACNSLGVVKDKCGREEMQSDEAEQYPLSPGTDYLMQIRLDSGVFVDRCGTRSAWR